MYDGNVEVGGPAQIRELTHMSIHKVAVGPLSNNVYLLRCRESGAQIMIDAASEPGTLIPLIGDHDLDIVLTTHRHPDHWQALHSIIEHTSADTAAPIADVEGIGVPIDRPLSHGDIVRFGSCELEVITVGGHTPGCSLFLYRDPRGHEHLFSGDALFPGGVGKTANDSDFDTLISGITAEVFDRLSDATWVYPGHGADTTLGAERPHLESWRTRRW